MPEISKKTVLATLKKLPDQSGNSSDIIRKLFGVDDIRKMGKSTPQLVLDAARDLEKNGDVSCEKTAKRGYVFTVVEKSEGKCNSLVLSKSDTEYVVEGIKKFLDSDEYKQPKSEPAIVGSFTPSEQQERVIEELDAVSQKEIFNAAVEIAGRILQNDHKAEATWVADKSLLVARHIARRIEKEIS